MGEKEKWLQRAGAIDVRKFDYYLPKYGHFLSAAFVENNSLEKLKRIIHKKTRSDIQEFRVDDLRSDLANNRK